MRYVEERDFTLRLDLRCAFPDAYDGERDGYAWVREFHADIVPLLVQAVVSVMRAHLGWQVSPANRRRALEDEISLVVERAP